MKIKELLSSPDKWCKKSYARKKDGSSTFPFENDAVSFCLWGAIIRCYEINHQQIIKEKIRQEIVRDIAVWNDDCETTFEDVKELVEKLDI